MADWFVYLVSCGDGSTYSGISTNVARRVADHAAGKGARYTRGRAPIALLGARGPFEKGLALRMEAWLKKRRKSEKLRCLLEVDPRLLETSLNRSTKRGKPRT